MAKNMKHIEKTQCLDISRSCSIGFTMTFGNSLVSPSEPPNFQQPLRPVATWFKTLLAKAPAFEASCVNINHPMWIFKAYLWFFVTYIMIYYDILWYMN